MGEKIQARKTMKHSSIRGTTYFLAFLFSVVLTIAGARFVSAQVTASISGAVSDASGASVPAATVTVRNVETGVTREVTTGENGVYRAVSLPVGRYEVRVAKAGFQTEIRSGLTLTVGQEAVVNLVLQVGAVTQEVMVTAEAPLVNTTTAETAGLVGERAVKDLPLNGRSFDTLITLNAGTVNFTSMKASVAAGNGNWFSVSGMRPEQNLFLMNGIEYLSASLIDTTPGGVSGQLLGIDAVREFNVVKDAYAAEYGKRSGGQVSVVTMSGTNQFHGTLFEFLRNSDLDARNFFDYPLGLRIPPFRRNNFGGSAGGPIRKNKTFVFGNYEGLRQRLGLSNVAVVPDNNARNGFLPNAQGQPVNVGLAPGVAPYFALWPVPNGPSLGDGTALLYSNPSSPITEDFFTTRVDHVFSEKDTLSGVYTFDSGNSITPTADPLSGSKLNMRNQVASLEEAHIFSPNVINSLRIGFSRGFFFLNNSPLVSFPTSLSYVEGRTVGALRVGGAVSGPTLVAQAGSSAVPDINDAVRNLFTFEDQVQITKGKHLISAGFHLQRLQNNATVGILNGQAIFPTLASFLAGKMSFFTLTGTSTEIGARQWNGAWFVQDAIRLGSNLTFTVGLRHEFTDGWNYVNGTGSNFIPGPGGVLLTAPRVGGSILTTNNAKLLFGPRAGLAWNPFGNGKTSIHAGFGIYYDLKDQMGFCCELNGPFNPTNLLIGATFPIHLTLAQAAALPGGVPRTTGIQPDISTPTVVRYVFKIEQQISSNLALSAGYVGSHGYHGEIAADLNTPFPTICSTTLQNCPAGLPNGTKYFPAGSPLRNPRLGAGFYYLGAGDSYYNALQVELTRRFSQGLQFRANYTFSRNIDNGSEVATANAINTPLTLLDPEDIQRDRGLAAFDIRHRFSASASYDLPFGKGKAFGGGISGVADKLLSGWRANAIINLQGGFPLTPELGFNQSRNGDSIVPDRPNMAAGRTLSGIYLRTPVRWFDPTAFALPVAGTYGNVGRTVLVGPGIATVDASLFKDTLIKENLRLEFRVEAFNLFNRPNFGLPSLFVLGANGLPTATAGRITNTSTTSRQVQLGLKLIW